MAMDTSIDAALCVQPTKHHLSRLPSNSQRLDLPLLSNVGTTDITFHSFSSNPDMADDLPIASDNDEQVATLSSITSSSQPSAISSYPSSSQPSVISSYPSSSAGHSPIASGSGNGSEIVANTNAKNAMKETLKAKMFSKPFTEAQKQNRANLKQFKLKVIKKQAQIGQLGEPSSSRRYGRNSIKICLSNTYRCIKMFLKFVSQQHCRCQGD